ncbi:MAG TPA: ATP-binding protein [Gemmatimonadales bacterium]|jgi:signal transduction histidine kinase|nr:ATP-binding protein [Gemmatimonadales bacterium]
MTTIRRRLAFWYTVALGLTLLGFGAALYYERQQSSLAELDRRLALEADIAKRWLVESYRVLGPLVPDASSPALDPGISAYLEAFRDYLIVVDTSGNVIGLSGVTRPLGAAEFQQLAVALYPPPQPSVSGTVDFGPPLGPVRYYATTLDAPGTGVGALLVATSIANVAFGPAELLRSMLVIAPVVLLGAAALGWWLAGTSVQPLLGIINELEAITDGRSLHRRLAVPRSGDEIQRLVVTANGMLARLEQSFASLRRFTADASHELKTPLMVLRAGVERGLTHPQTPRDVMQGLDETLEQINQMTEMVDDLLTLARADEGRAPLALEETDLRELVADVSETAGMLGEGGKLTVTTQIPEQPVRLAVDRHRIRELLLNLVTNAIKYTPPGGTVGLTLGSSDDHATLVVSDSGIGIAPGDLPHIFDRFWRADPARSRTGERPGIGLGLAITKWIAEAHGGSITVQSRPGRGSVFTVRLPKNGRERGETGENSRE